MKIPCSIIKEEIYGDKNPNILNSLYIIINIFIGPYL